MGARDSKVGKHGVRTAAARFEMIIERDIKHVWPRMIKYHDWNPEHIGATVERVLGDPQTEGEIVIETDRSDDGQLPNVVIETVKLVPFETVIWAMYDPEKGATDGIWFVELALDAVGDFTRLTYRSQGWVRDTEWRAEFDRKAIVKLILDRLGELMPVLRTHAES
jgi:hypothetical protein